MLMEINNIYNSYTAETDCSKKDISNEESATKENVQYSSVKEYYAVLSEKFAFFNKTTSIQGVPTTVSVSPAFKKKCLNDPEKMKYLESNLKAIPDCVKSLVDYTKTMPGNPVTTYTSYSIDENGNISCMSGCTNDPDGKIARENAKRKMQEKKAAEEKADRRRADKKAMEEKTAEKRAERKEIKKQAVERAAESKKIREYNIRIMGSDVKTITQSIAMKLFGTYTSSILSFDVKA
ncbi:MAG: hypothetical protein J6K58_00180 [Lachnospiraceae bacterium]|nr:hypothetical protein [Lachnospiraceae bacterium]